MSAHDTLVGPGVVCGNPVRHAPRPLIFDLHHVIPESWGGSDGPKITLCPSCHHSTHILIDLYVKLGRKPTAHEVKLRFGHLPSNFLGALADKAWAQRPPDPTPTS